MVDLIEMLFCGTNIVCDKFQLGKPQMGQLRQVAAEEEREEVEMGFRLLLFYLFVGCGRPYLLGAAQTPPTDERRRETTRRG